MQRLACPLCDARSPVPVIELTDRLLGLEGTFQMVRCSACSLHYLDPQPEPGELERYYPADYAPFNTPFLDELPPLRRLSLRYGLDKRRRAVEHVRPGASPGRLLELGCANGLFLDHMRRAGWEVDGVDTSEWAVRQARERLGLELFHGTLEQAGLPGAAFDAVALWDVLEHIGRPRQALLEIRRVLKPDGVLVLRVPVLDAWERRLFGAAWSGWDAPRHLVLFSRATLHRMLESAGFRVVRMACIAGGYSTFALSLRFRARGRASAAAQERLRRILEALPTRLAAAPAFALLDRLGMSTVLTVTARPSAGAAID